MPEQLQIFLEEAGFDRELKNLTVFEICEVFNNKI